jgi:PAS domain S-box-containing protein
MEVEPMKDIFNFVLPGAARLWKNQKATQPATTGELVPPVIVSSPLAILAVAVVYALAAKAALQVTILPSSISPVFPDAGIALAAVLILGRAALLGVWLGSFMANVISFSHGTVTQGHSVLTALLVASTIAMGAMACASAGAFLVRRFCKDENPLHSGYGVLILVTVGALGACMVGPTFGVLGLSLGGYVPWEGIGYAWLTWWAGDAAGAIVVAPLILAWHFHYSCKRRSWLMLEMAVLGVVTLLLCIFVLFQQNAHFEYCLLPLLLWAAFRFGMRGAATAAAAIAIFATLGTSVDSSPFAGGSVDESLILLYSFMGVTIVSALILAGILAERKRVEEALLLTQFCVDHASDAILWMTPDARIVNANAAACRSLGYSREELLQLTVPEIDARFNAEKWPQHFTELRQRGSLTHESEHRTKDGRLIPVEIVANHIQFGSEQRNCAFVRDITARKQAEAYREIDRQVLQILTEPGGLADSSRLVLGTMKKLTGLDAVGIRLQDGEDFPYFVQQGFADDFLLAEGTLLRRAADGKVQRDCNGKACLECTCGLVISGTTDPVHPFFTRGGSFWINDSAALLEPLPAQDLPIHSRGQCPHRGYASFALVPIRNKSRIIGLIQLNDRRQGCFSLEAVELMEGIAAHIGEALMRKRAEEALRQSTADLHALAARLQAVREEERVTLSRELHDSLGQHLTSLQIDLMWADQHLQSVKPPNLVVLGDRIVAMVPLVERLTEQTQTLCAALRPSVLYDLGLVAAIEWQVEETAKRTGLICAMALPEADLELENDVALALFRIVQEALTNVVRHAQATHVEVRLHSADSALELEIQDNGSGFAPQSISGSKALGLLGMRERAGVFGGTVEFLNVPGKGAAVRVSVPCNTSPNGLIECS